MTSQPRAAYSWAEVGRPSWDAGSVCYGSPAVVTGTRRAAQFYLHSEKSYEGVICFGFATDTYDADGEATTPARDITLELESLRD